MIPLQERIKQRVIVDQNGCWIWQGSKLPGKRPYGRITVGSRSDKSRATRATHRVAYEVFVGPVSAGLCVCHRCDVPSCVNPEHLFLGTKKDNADDRDIKGRNVKAPLYHGEDAPWSKLSDDQVAAIKASPLSSTQAARQFGISDSYVRQLRRGEYHHV